MPTIHIVFGEHFSVPGIVTSAHKTQDGANKRASELVNLMLKDSKIKLAIDAATWSGGLKKLHRLHGEQACDVEVIDLEIED